MTITPQPTRTQTAWTTAALDEGRRRGIGAAQASLTLPAGAQIDDHIEMRGNDRVVTFIARRRVWWVAADGEWSLRIELDHPPRPAGLR